MASALAVGDRVPVTVRGMASSGAGVVDLPDGRVAFVHRTAPGEEAVVRIDRLRPRWATATLLSLDATGPDRVAAACPLYEECGGCTLQHLDYPAQLAWKSRFVTDALQRIGGMRLPEPEVVASPKAWRYRNRITLTVRRLRGGRVVAGFHALGRPDRLTDITDECLLPEEGLMRAWSGLRASWGQGAARLPPARQLRVTLRSVEGGVALLVRGGGAGWDAGDLLSDVPGGRALWHQPAEGEIRLVAGGPTEEVWEGERVPVGGRAFLQVNRESAALLATHVLALAESETGGTVAMADRQSTSGIGDGSLAAPTGPSLRRPPRAVDAYSGVGIYGRELARRGWSVVGIEVDPEACAAARHDRPDGFDVAEDRVEDRLRGCLPADLVIVNPPRTGLAGEVPGILLDEPPPHLLYVSCDPATLARDAARLAPKYNLTALRSFDLFPQTAHVETVALFSLQTHEGTA
ncbi:MAG: TRAM domain-containing protein [Gemmatimonadetes bacterium]|nr:TRAM domain-containing protein [Gemmatimonadota bacterium]